MHVSGSRVAQDSGGDLSVGACAGSGDPRTAAKKKTAGEVQGQQPQSSPGQTSPERLVLLLRAMAFWYLHYSQTGTLHKRNVRCPTRTSLTPNRVGVWQAHCAAPAHANTHACAIGTCRPNAWKIADCWLRDFELSSPAAGQWWRRLQRLRHERDHGSIAARTVSSDVPQPLGDVNGDNIDDF